MDKLDIASVSQSSGSTIKNEDQHQQIPQEDVPRTEPAILTEGETKEVPKLTPDKETHKSDTKEHLRTASQPTDEDNGSPATGKDSHTDGGCHTSCHCSGYVVGLDESQPGPSVAKPKLTVEQNCTKNQIRVFKLYGGLYAEIEKLFSIHHVDVGFKYAKYRQNTDNRPTTILDSISSFLSGIEQINQIVKKKKWPELRFAEDQPTFDLWFKSFELLKSVQKEDEAEIQLEILHFTLSCIKRRQICSLPPDLDDQIFDLEEIKEAEEDMLGKSQQEFLNLIEKTQNAAMADELALSKFLDLKPDEVLFSHDPLY